MTEGFGRRLKILLGSVSAVALVAGIGTTQIAAWMLNFDPALGTPIVAHIYWPWKIIEWWTSPWAPDFPVVFDRIKFGSGIVAALVVMAFVKARQQRPQPQPEALGSARFANASEVRASSLFPRGIPGIVVGGWKDEKGNVHYLTDTSEGHVLCLGPSRIGKTASTMLPTLLSVPDPVVVFDPKGELWKQTAGWRAKEADNVVMRFAPADTVNTIRWNPFDRVRRNTPFVYRDVANIIQQICDPQGKGSGDHWEESAARLLSAVAMLLVVDGLCTPAAVLAALDASPNLAQLFTFMSNHRVRQVADEGRSMLSTADRERASIVSTARRMLKLFRDPVVAANTNRSDFLIEDLVHHDKPVSLYIETRGEDQERMRPLVRLMLSLIIGQLISEDDCELRRPLIIAIDEVPSLRKMEPVELFLTKGAGARMRALLLAQDYQDIVGEYGVHERITAECNVLTTHAPNSVLSAEWLSKRIGQTTVVMDQVSVSQGRGQRSTNQSLHHQPRTLMTPEEVMRLRLPERDAHDRITVPGDMMIFQAGARATQGVQSLAFLDVEYRRRMEIPAPPTMRVRPPPNLPHTNVQTRAQTSVAVP